MKTHQEALADAAARADAIQEPYIIFRDTTQVPPFAFGCCSERLWSKAGPSRMLVKVATVEPTRPANVP